MGNIEFIKLTVTAKLPLRASEFSSGFDFYADNFKIVFPSVTINFRFD